MTVNVLWARGNRGSWDAGLLEHATSGRLWPLPMEFHHTMGLIPEREGGAVVAIAGRHMYDEDGKRYLRAALNKLPWSLIYHLGDEELRFPSEQFRYPGRRIALQCPSPFMPIQGDRNIPLGWPEDCRAWLSKESRKAASGRLLWGFAGQVNHDQRQQLVDALRARPKGEGLLYPSEGFGQGLNREEYYRLLANSCVIPCPSGAFSPETFRLYEALEAGCLPVGASVAPNGGWPADFSYWNWRYPDHPFEDRFEWTRIDRLLEVYREEPAMLQEAMTECLAWWIGEKRRFALDLVQDCRELGAEVAVPPVTVLIPCSPIPSHPSLEVIENTIKRIRSYPELHRAEIIIMCDGVRPDLEHRMNDYREYLRVLVDRCNWDPDWFGCLPLIFEEWSHQSIMARKALELVRTPLVFYVEHDTFPIGGIPFQLFEGALGVLPKVNYIRLHIFDSVLTEHEHLYANHGVDFGGARFIETKQWSQRPHLARAGWYRELLDKHFKPSERSFIEDTMHGVAQDGGVDGLYVYAPEGSMLRSGTSDGRKDDAKAPHGVGR